MVFFGSFIAAVSVFLPWYRDLDAFKIGDQFLGITGPLYLVGLIILTLSAVCFLNFVSESMRLKIEKLPVKVPFLYILVGAINLFLLILTNSVYFHPKFGVNIMLKEFRFGMILAFIGTGFVLIGGILQYKKRAVSFDDLDAKVEPLIKIQDRLHGDLAQREKSLEEVIDETKKDDSLKFDL